MIKMGIAGCQGRMGQLLVEEVTKASDLEFSGGFDRNSEKTAEDIFNSSDLVIDFSSIDASLYHAKLASDNGKALLIGTTGFASDQINELRSHAARAPILLSANTSLGVNLLVQLTKKVASVLGPEYAIEILETHHKHKVDAPSGTALALGRAAADGRKIDFETHKAIDRNSARNADDIGFAVMRGGDVVGEHTVYFYGEGERIELTHRATDRKLFAKGAIATARWLAAQKPGFYTMDDFLKIF